MISTHKKKRFIIAGMLVLQLQLIEKAYSINCGQTMNQSIKQMREHKKLMTSDLDAVNLTYFNILYRQQQNPAKDSLITIADESMPVSKKTIKAYPTSIASRELMKEIDVYHYADLDESYAKAAADVSLWIKKMHAGTGSSLTRESFLKDIFGESTQIKIGAKGTDLFVQITDGTTKKYISLAEIQLLQLYHLANSPSNQMEIIVQDIVGPETQKSLSALWNKPSLINPLLSYKDLFDAHPLLSRNGKTFQSHIPTISEDGNLTKERVAPGGHALFAVDGLLASYKSKMRPKNNSSKTLISAIANGEDLSGKPDAKILGLMKKKNIPIAMVTTTKTKNDLKGGQIAIIKKQDGSVYTTIIEKAQAEQADQLSLFEELGLRANDEIAFFNTNMALINYEVLTPLIEKLVKEIGEKKFMEIISPDLILNKKSQLNEEGVKKFFTQLEGAMGSVLLNLDKYWRDNYKKGLVSFINVDAKKRTDFFAPIKTAFDFYMQFYSDRFVLNQTTMDLVNNRPDALPSVSFADPFYSDTKNVLTAFKDTSILHLDKLSVSKGVVNLSDIVLKGNIIINNQSGKIINIVDMLNETMRKAEAPKIVGVQIQDNKVILDNVTLNIGKEGKLLVKLNKE